MQKFLWWQKDIIYQIYPLSFMDSNNDGCGDLRGIINRLHYLEWLNIDAIWLSPIFESPMVDLGYDITNHKQINPIFGTMQDFEELLAACHALDIKVILDYVPNHTSDQHSWFLESRSSRSNPKRDWYLWKDAAENGGPPNNWLSAFGGSAWEWDEKTEQYYYHAFYPQQPDLNWRNPMVQDAMFDIMRFWFDKGVDGFRIDVLWHLIKDERFRDNPINPEYEEGKSEYHCFIPVYSADQPEVHDIVVKMRKIADEYNDRVLIGEIYLPIQQLVNYYGLEQRPGIHLPFNFQFILCPWNAFEIYTAINDYEATLPDFAWPNWVLGNHDQSRVINRLGISQAKIAAMLLFMLRGTPVVYYGDELGMSDTPIPRIPDPESKQFPNLGSDRSPERSPMQWAPFDNAGFSCAKSWLPINENYLSFNVETEAQHDNSMLMFYYRLMELRKEEAALQIGRYIPACQHGNALSFLRHWEDRLFLIAVNLGESDETLTIPDQLPVSGKIVFGTHPDSFGRKVSQQINLKPNEGIVGRLIYERGFYE
ncbi:MAG: alpha-amylase family glycosyl hydrolase [Candidatus Omnitrophota bacterium]